MNIIVKHALTTPQKENIFKLWNNEYFQSISHNTLEDLEGYLNKLTQKRHIMLVDNENVLGWCLTFNREDARWFIILLDSKLHKKGFGSKLLDKAKENETELNGWVITHDDYFKNNGEPYKSPVGFYKKNGFTICEQIKLELEEFIAIKIQWQDNKQ